jgi:predicted nucleic acid-binding protein
MADATRYNGAVSRLHAITAAVMLLTRIRAAAAASPTLGTCPFSHRAYREASSGHLQKIFDRAGFDTSRGAMWFTKHDDAPLDCEDCHHVSSASAYGCPMLVRALSSPPSLTRNND